MKITVKLVEKNDKFIATCPELDINCYAGDKNEAIRRMQNVINFYIESAQEFGLDVESMTELIVDGKKQKGLSQSKIHAISETIN
ncbi:MAG: hypothetical protein FWG13_00350 [Leptospirales bacterium]|nr:hypothetical protein [Leptospirales bacterium]